MSTYLLEIITHLVSYNVLRADRSVNAPHFFFGLESAIGPKIRIIPKQNQES